MHLKTSRSCQTVSEPGVPGVPETVKPDFLNVCFMAAWALLRAFLVAGACVVSSWLGNSVWIGFCHNIGTCTRAFSLKETGEEGTYTIFLLSTAIFFHRKLVGAFLYLKTLGSFFSNLTKLSREERKNRQMVLNHISLVFLASQAKKERDQVNFFLLHFPINQYFQRCSGTTVVLAVVGGHHSAEHCWALPAAVFVTACSFFPFPISQSPWMPLIWRRLWGVGGQGQLAREENNTW